MLIFITILRIRYNCLYFTDEDTEGHREKETCPNHPFNQPVNDSMNPGLTSWIFYGKKQYGWSGYSGLWGLQLERLGKKADLV